MDAFSYCKALTWEIQTGDTVYKDKGIKMNWQEQIIESACGASGDISVDLVIEILASYITALEQAIVLCDSSDPDRPVMDGKLYAKAIEMIETTGTDNAP